MVEPVILLDANIIKNHTNIPINIDIFANLNSTNDYLLNIKDKSQLRICIAEEQCAGRGRLLRKWYAPFGLNLYFSCLYPFHKNIAELGGLSLVTSLAVNKVINDYYLPEPSMVKWPNDIYYQTKKMAGILIDIKKESDEITTAIIGIGINVNMVKEENSLIGKKWTSLRTILQKKIDRNLLAATLITELIKHLKQFEAKGMRSFLPDWHKQDYLINKTIQLSATNKTITGVAKGINTNGYLLLELEQNRVQSFSSGETTVIYVDDHA